MIVEIQKRLVDIKERCPEVCITSEHLFYFVNKKILYKEGLKVDNWLIHRSRKYCFYNGM
jgi:hypothetical protein